MAEDRPISTVNTEYATPPVSVLALDSGLEPPRASFFSPGPSIGDNSSRESRALSGTGPEGERESSTPAHSTAFLPTTKDTEGAQAPFSQYATESVPFYRRPLWLAIAVAALVVLLLVIIIPVTVIKHHGNSSNNISNNPGSGTSTSAAAKPSGTPTNTGAITGGDGSTIFTSNGSFTYVNSFGGTWYYDPKDPFNNAAQPNSWTKPLNQTWDWSIDRAYGVNLGGLFVLEPFITPALYQKYPSAVDEWTLSTAMAADTGPGGGLQPQLEAHYNTFITEQDMAEIAAAGLNWIRLPIPFWAIETWSGEPFLERVCWKYILRIFQWARKYGIRINLDLHTIPGSQNAFNHSGRYGQVNWLNGIMGYANAQRTLDYIRIITEFISQPEYQNLIPVFSIVNEPLLSTIGQNALTSFYLQAHTMIRGITGYGTGHGPYIAIHDGFGGLANWAGFLPNSDRFALDVHPYLAFNGNDNTAPIVAIDGSQPGGSYVTQACGWGATMNTSQTAFGVSFSGEFSSGYNPCGLFLLGVGNTATTTGACALFTDSSTWNDTLKEGILAFTEGSMDALQNWWFWTWKIDNSTAGKVESPLWSYKHGLAGGWIPTDPRKSVGKCQALGVAVSAAGAYSAWQTGGAGAGTIAAAETRSYPWPPATLSGLGGAAYNLVPTYTPTATISTLPPAQLTPSASQGNGWYDAQDTASAMVTVSGCSYPNAWDSAGAVAPTALCPAGASPQVTAAPAATATSAAAATTAAAAATTSVAAATSAAAADTTSTAAA